MSNMQLAQVALNATKAPGYIRMRGMCARFVREVCATYYGIGGFPPHVPDARAQYDWFAKRGYSVPVGNGSVIGDLLYKLGSDDGEHGHVGIRIAGNKVAENSSAHGGEGGDGRGVRTLSQFGQVDGIVRLPAK